MVVDTLRDSPPESAPAAAAGTPKHVLVLHYSQTGQLDAITEQIVAPLRAQPGIVLHEERLRPLPEYPFPWPFFRFLDAFPESAHLVPPTLAPLGLRGDERFDLIILPYQVWFLAPSLPITAFLKHPVGRRVLQGTPVVTVIACRNMWLAAQEKMKALLADAGARLIDNVVLTDPGPTLATFITTPRWLLSGRKAGFWGLPAAGVDEAQIRATRRFGLALREALARGDERGPAPLLGGLRAVRAEPNLWFSERAGTRGFYLWGLLLRRAGPPRSVRRIPLLVLYVSCLVSLIATLVPISLAMQALLRPFLRGRLTTMKARFELPSGSASERMAAYVNDVFVTRTGAYLPFEPVANEDIESVLGQVGGKPSRARRLVLRSNGITARHYAIDRATGEPAMSNAQLTAAAVRALGDFAEIGPIDCLATGTSLPDQLMPNHGVMVHGELGWPRLEVVACAGICLASVAALKHAWLSVRAGEARRAVATGSELVSPSLLARHFEPEIEHRVNQLAARPEIAFEKDFLRWMLSDGAGAMLLEDRPRGPLSLRIDWIELSSAAHQLPVCMYAGADKRADDSLRGWLHVPPEDWNSTSIFSIKQDVRLLNDNVVRAAVAEPLADLMQRRDLRAERIDWLLPHLSSAHFEQPVIDALAQVGLPVPRERWFTNLSTRGNTGSASPFIMLDELFRSGRIERGHRILIGVPESGRFSSGFIHMEAV